MKSYLDLTLHDFFDIISNNYDEENEFVVNYSDIEVYNYLEKLTSDFNLEKVEIVLIDIYMNYCLLNANYDFDENAEALVKYAVKLLRGKYKDKTKRVEFDEYEKKIFDIDDNNKTNKQPEILNEITEYKVRLFDLGHFMTVNNLGAYQIQNDLEHLFDAEYISKMAKGKAPVSLNFYNELIEKYSFDIVNNSMYNGGRSERSYDYEFEVSEINIDYKKKYYALLEENRELSKRQIETLEKLTSIRTNL
jgi:hypothetical protein